MTTAFVDRPGFRLAHEVSGAGEGGPWLVLSHSLGSSRAMWRPQLPLLQAKFRVLAYDTRGHGESTAPPGPYRIEDLAQDVVALMDHLGIAKASYMGLSLGGVTGLGLAVHHPTRLERLICCDTRADAPPAAIATWDERLAAIDRSGLGALVGGTMERWFVERYRKAHPEHIAEFEATYVKTSVAGFKGCVEALKSVNLFNELHKIEVPVLYVAGEHDQAASPDIMRAMAKSTPKARLAIIGDAAHLPNVDSTVAFNAAISDFLGRAA